MSDITIYGFPQSTYVRTARMVAEEKGATYDLEDVDLKSEAYRQLHPFAKMPAMRHGDLVLYETSAIARYLDDSFEGVALQPKDVRARARMEQWISAINDYVYEVAIRRYVLQFVFPKGADGKPDMTVIRAAIPDLQHQLGVFDAALTDGDYLAGPALSLADLFLAPILFYVGKMPKGEKLLAECPNLARHIAAIERRPSFAATLPPMPERTAAE